MLVVTTVGPNNSTEAVLPFVAGKGAMKNGDSVALFAMQEATYLGSAGHADLGEIKAPGLPTVGDVVDVLRDEDALEAFVVCQPCAKVRGISEDDLRPWAKLGGAADLARLAEEHGTTLTF